MIVVKSNYLGVQLSPDNMTRNHLIVCIKSFDDFREAEKFWLKWGLKKISKRAFFEARGY